MTTEKADIAFEIRQLRRSNLAVLVRKYGGQTQLARAIEGSNLTQPKISQKLGQARRKTYLTGPEARELESRLDIPLGWIDSYPMDEAWRFVEIYRALSHDVKNIIDPLMSFLSKGSNYQQSKRREEFKQILQRMRDKKDAAHTGRG